MTEVKEMTGEEAIQAIIPVDTQQLQTYTSFSGADIVVKLNGHFLGEVYELHYMERLKAERDESGNLLPNVEGKLDSYIFSTVPQIRRALQEVPRGMLFSDQLEVLLMNEFGNKVRMSFTNAQFTYAKAKFSVDDVIIGERFHFVADAIEFTEVKEQEDAAV